MMKGSRNKFKKYKEKIKIQIKKEKK